MNPAALSITDLLHLIASRVLTTPEPFEKLDGSFLFQIGNGASKFLFINCRQPIQVEDTEREADCTVSLSENDFRGIVEGTANPQSLFLSGRLKAAGPLHLLLALHRLLAPLPVRFSG